MSLASKVFITHKAEFLLFKADRNILALIKNYLTNFVYQVHSNELI